jgi:hypothetical protein
LIASHPNSKEPEHLPNFVTFARGSIAINDFQMNCFGQPEWINDYNYLIPSCVQRAIFGSRRL